MSEGKVGSLKQMKIKRATKTDILIWVCTNSCYALTLRITSNDTVLILFIWIFKCSHLLLILSLFLWGGSLDMNIQRKISVPRIAFLLDFLIWYWCVRMGDSWRLVLCPQEIFFLSRMFYFCLTVIITYNIGTGKSVPN